METKSTDHKSDRLISVAPATGIDIVLTYRVPDELSGPVAAGTRVLVPLGKRVVTGFVVGQGGDYSGEIRDIVDILDDHPLFDEKTLAFYRFIAEYYAAPIGEVIKRALPKGFAVGSRRIVTMVNRDGGSSEIERRIVELASAKGGIGVRLLEKKFPGKAVNHYINRLVQDGVVTVEERLADAKVPRRGERSVRAVSGEVTGETEKLLSRSPKMKMIFEEVCCRGEIPYAELIEKFGNVSGQVGRLSSLGVAEVVTCYRERAIASPDMASFRPEELSRAQQEALEGITRSLRTGEFSVCLLFGVTGSGKTEVYIRAVEEALRLEKSALVLVPEISLTPQLMSRFVACFGETVALFHSDLTDTRRLEQWWRVKTRAARVVLGARSALFAPMSDIGIIIVDEEHDPSYKQSETPRYHARDAAVMLGRIMNAPVVLGSATPSLESMENVKRGRYLLASLPDRVTKVGKLPDVEIVDIRQAEMATRSISQRLADEIKHTVDAGRQVILLLNRRGFSSFILCPNCGHTFPCPSCSITLTYHKGPRTMLCHYCGFSHQAPDECPSCGAFRLLLMGVGIERVAEELSEIVPDAAILRLDRDTAKKKGEIQKILEAFANRRANILLGTQMVAKGHDFPDVTLVGVVNADIALNFPDFRSGERTFTLLTQAAGRAGRGDIPSQVIIQTYNPNHYAVRAAADHDWEAFAREELVVRQELSYPPFSRLALIRLTGDDCDAVIREAAQIGRACGRVIAEGKLAVSLLGPAPSPIVRMKDQYRYQLVLKGDNRRHLFEVLDFVSLLGGKRERRGVSITVDIDPTDMV